MAEFSGGRSRLVRDNIKSYTFKVDSERDFKWDSERLELNLPADVWGVTDKKTGTILLRMSEPRTEAGFLLAGLHECVHLVSDPVVRRAAGSAAKLFLDYGLLEGLVEVVTEDVLIGQGISLPANDLKGHVERTTIMRALIEPDIDPWARLLFQGNSTDFVEHMSSIYGRRNWELIKAFANLKSVDRARIVIASGLAKRQLELAKSYTPYKSFSSAKARQAHLSYAKFYQK